LVNTKPSGVKTNPDPLDVGGRPPPGRAPRRRGNGHLQVNHCRRDALHHVRHGRRVRVEKLAVTLGIRPSGTVVPPLDRFIRNQRQHPNTLLGTDSKNY
jgi:hypothetical protein